MAALPSYRTDPEETVNAAMPTPQPPALRMTMYFSPEGALHHTRCRRPLHFRGIRAELEGDFWCSACHEHVTLPKYAVSHVPVESEGERTNVLRLVR
jgi:hypothetical protein